MALPAKTMDRFTYRDYLSWPDDERWELIDGVIFNMTPAPTHSHQRVVVRFLTQLETLLTGSDCEPIVAPFDVRLPEGDEDDEAVATVVQPDIIVVCDKDKLDERGCRGAPDFVVEVLSPSTAKRDQYEKVTLYEKHGVREYWVIDPVHQLVTVRVLGTDGRFRAAAIRPGEGLLEITALRGLKIDLDAVFQTLGV